MMLLMRKLSPCGSVEKDIIGLPDGCAAPAAQQRLLFVDKSDKQRRYAENEEERKEFLKYQCGHTIAIPP